MKNINIAMVKEKLCGSTHYYYVTSPKGIEVLSLTMTGLLETISNYSKLHPNDKILINSGNTSQN